MLCTIYTTLYCFGIRTRQGIYGQIYLFDWRSTDPRRHGHGLQPTARAMAKIMSIWQSGTVHFWPHACLSHFSLKIIHNMLLEPCWSITTMHPDKTRTRSTAPCTGLEHVQGKYGNCGCDCYLTSSLQAEVNPLVFLTVLLAQDARS